MIKIIAKSESGEHFELTLNEGESALVGRAKGCDLVLPSKTVSRKHLSFKVDEYGELHFEKISRFSKAIYEGGDHPGGNIKPGEKIIIGEYELSFESVDGVVDETVDSNIDSESKTEFLSESGELGNQSSFNEEFSGSLDEESEIHSEFLQSHDPNSLKSEDPASFEEDSDENEQSDEELILSGDEDSGIASSDSAEASNSDEFEQSSESEGSEGSEEDPFTSQESAAPTEEEPTATFGDKTAKLDSLEHLLLGVEEAPIDEFKITEGKWTIGRDQDADLTLDDVKASRKHCEIELSDKAKVTVRDLNSGNGTYVNERKINEKVLVPGDRLRVGSVVFTYELRNREFFEQVADLPAVADEDNSEEFLPDRNYALSVVDGGKEEDPDTRSYVSSGSGRIIRKKKRALFDHSTLNRTLPTGVGVAPETKVFGVTSNEEGASKGEKESLVSKYKRMEPRRRLIYLGIVGIILIYVLEDDPVKKAQPRKGKTGQQQKGSKGKVKGGVVTDFEQLTKDEQLLVDTSYNKAMRHLEGTEFTMALSELERIFQYLPDYKEARNLQAVAKKGYAEITNQKRQFISELEQKKREQELQQILAKLEQLRSEEKYDEAQELFPRVFEIDPDNILVSEIQSDIRKIEEEKARKAREDAIAQTEREKNLEIISVARKLLGQNDYNGAIEHLQQLSEEGGSAESSEAKDMISFIKNERDTKISEYRNAAQACKDQEDKVCEFQNYVKALEIDPSAEQIQEASRKIASEMEGAAKKIYTEAVITKSLGQVKKARDLFKQVLERTPPGSDYNDRAKRNLEVLFMDDEDE